MKVNDFNFESHSIAAIQKKVPENINLIRDPKKSVGILGLQKGRVSFDLSNFALNFQHGLCTLGNVGSAVWASGPVQGAQVLAQQVPHQRMGGLLSDIRGILHRQHCCVDCRAVLCVGGGRPE